MKLPQQVNPIFRKTNVPIISRKQNKVQALQPPIIGGHRDPCVQRCIQIETNNGVRPVTPDLVNYCVFECRANRY